MIAPRQPVRRVKLQRGSRYVMFQIGEQISARWMAISGFPGAPHQSCSWNRPKQRRRKFGTFILILARETKLVSKESENLKSKLAVKPLHAPSTTTPQLSSSPLADIPVTSSMTTVTCSFPFLTARPFDGEVKLVVTDSKSWWITKYLLVLQKLSKYPVIDLDMDKEVHCFKQVTVGLRAHNEFHIDPTRSPNGYTMIDFAKFMRSAFSSEREALLNIEDLAARKPRLLIVGRKQSRVLTNTKEIVEMAEELGFEVVVEEADAGSDLARVGRTVNSCDVMVGVHGTGLTNSVFLPMNAILIQIVPWGRLESKAMQDYGNPAKEMGLGYLEYSIAIEESSLREKYPRDHPVFTDPLSFHSRGYHVMRATFMDDQNVKLDVRKFKEVLWKALEHLIR
ncbi:unnamed protein product [Musa textilis]